ncbi:MAG: tetratricopeptide repeat protein [Acidobacteria bacterium]|nr:tetratricopeptide repeat protein [Acidobacteriota bacterium]
MSLAAALPAAAAKPETWSEARSAHFHVVTNAKPKAAAEAVQKLEEFRHLLSLMFPGIRLDPPAPARVILFKDTKSFEPYAPRITREKSGRMGGFMQPGAERMYLAINRSAPESQHVVFHEYIHLVLALNLGRVPIWLNEGVAEYYERTQINKAEFVTGEYHPGSWQVLQMNKPIPLASLVRMDYNSEPFRDQKQVELFYAQSWLLVHYIMVGDEGKHRPQFNKFIQLLLRGQDQDTAFTEAFGTDYRGMEQNLRGYLRSQTLNVYAGKMLKTAEAAPVEFTPMDSAVAEAYLTDLWANRGDVARADEALQRLAQAGSPPPEVLERLGRIALQQGKPLEAEKHLETALAAQPNDLGLAYYTAWAVSQGRMGRGDEEARRAAATRVVELLSPHLDSIQSFPHAYHLLIQARLARNDPPAELIPVVERARQLMPLEREFDFLLAHLYEREQKWDEAEKLLAETARRAEEPGERRRAEEFLNHLRRRREYLSQPQGPTQVVLEGDSPAPTGEPAAGSRDSVEPTPAAPAAPPEVRYIRGTLVDVQCSDQDDSARVTVSLDRKAGEAARVVHLRVRSRARLILLDPTKTGRQLDCGPAEAAVAVNYRLEAQGETVSGVVMTIEFDPPPPPR